MLPPNLLISPMARAGLLALGAVVVLGGAYLSGRGHGADACEQEHQAALVEALQRQQVVVIAAQARGDELSARLATTQRKLQATEKEYLTYANAITGHCPAALGVLVNAASHGDDLPQATVPPAATPPADETPDVAAQIIGANVATNYQRFQACLAQLNALIDWHQADLK